MLLEDFFEGQVIEHKKSKTITDADNHLFCLLTMNHHRLHIDSEYASHTRYGQPVVVGTYLLALVVGMTVDDISWDAVANLQYDEVIHHAPVFVGDTLRADTIVLKITRRVVEVLTIAYNQGGEKVLSFKRKILL